MKPVKTNIHDKIHMKIHGEIREDLKGLMGFYPWNETYLLFENKAWSSVYNNSKLEMRMDYYRPKGLL